MRLLVLALLGAAGLSVASGCATSRPATRAAAPDAAPDAPPRKTVAEATSAAARLDGLFPVYRDTTTGGLQMYIRTDQLGQDFIYVTHVADGAPVGGHFRGQYRDNRVVTFRRYFDRVEVVAENTSFYFDPESEIARAATANISPAILAVQKVVAEDSAGVLVDADPLFLTEALALVKPPAAPGRPPTAFALGTLSPEKTKVTTVRSYPENTDVVVQYVYDNPAPLNAGGPDVTDARSVSVLVQHSLVAMPAAPFEPLADDPRVGYFTQRVTDLTTESPTPYRDLVNRWRLVKRDSSAAVSEPAEPIVFWIENTTPARYRDTIRRATLAWNEAFEAAGFSNAVEVREQPDDADWDAGDLRYNVLRWTSSPNPPFGGYGPSYVNPRTGQILGADIMLEFMTIGRARFQAQVLAGADEAEAERAVEEFLYYLVLHEVGHTLGLNHNMRASTALSREAVHDRALTERVGLLGSVMDYPAVNVAPPGRAQGQYYATRPGPYDVWAVQFAYGALSPAERQALLARSTEPALAFGNDADDMRSPGKAVDPRVMVNDLSSDAIGYAEDRMALVRARLAGLAGGYAARPGRSYDELRDAFGLLVGQVAQSAAVFSRYVGGVYVDRAFVGQAGADRPYRPVPEAEQRRALRALTDHVFAPDAFDMPEELLAALQPQRRGFDFFATSEDPKVHAQVLAIHRATLDHLLHPATLQRITDSRLYGNTYALAEVMDDLTAALFEADARGPVNTFRQNLQTEYVTRLAAVVENEPARYDAVAQAAAVRSLRAVERQLGQRRGANAETEAHAELLRLLIERALDTRE